ncbi:MAG TPA: ABC transporter ATP-binding protein [Anaeromyxobacteraceae bacterium]|nr:ABC transporter ATP-binding protein [Anaeromyxobacteraceae bacterium]
MSLALKDVELRVGAETHVHPTRLELSPAGFNVLLGPTLAGKTTLLRLMAGLLRPTAGEVWFGGRDVTGVPVRRRRVAMVYQQFINYPHLSVFDNIASPLHVARVPAAEVRSRVSGIAELLQLGPLLDRRPGQLSGGQQQRAALARALVKDADLVLLDEPLANLDYKLREGLRDELPRLFADRRCTVVYATTEPAEALLLGGHTATVHAGRVTQFGATASVYRHPADLTTARAFSDPPLNTAAVAKLGDRIELGRVATWRADGALAGLPDGQYTFGLRPHHVQPASAGGPPRAVAVAGRVSISEISGSDSVVHFDLDGGTWVSQSHGVKRFDVGETAGFRLDVARGMYFTADGRCVSAGGN